MDVNKASVLAMFDHGWNQGNIDVFADSIADSVVFHYAGSSRELSREQMGAMVLRWREAFPDLSMNIDDIIAEGNTVATRLTLSGTHEGVWAGSEPTGRRVSMALTMFFRFEDGRMVELWESDDQIGFRKQLGIDP